MTFLTDCTEHEELNLSGEKNSECITPYCLLSKYVQKTHLNDQQQPQHHHIPAPYNEKCLTQSFLVLLKLN